MNGLALLKRLQELGADDQPLCSNKDSSSIPFHLLEQHCNNEDSSLAAADA